MTELEFRQRVMPLKRLMYAVALKMAFTPDDAADVVQESLIKLWNRRELIPPDPRELRLYCMTTLRNECISALRRRRETVSIETVVNFSSQESERTELKDLLARIEQLIDSLPRGQALAIRLSCFNDLDTAEIAQSTGQTENNVRQLLSRGRRKLKELWTF